MADREQTVVINGIFSRFTAVISGVPQGSILGPLLWSPYGIGQTIIFLPCGFFFFFFFFFALPQLSQIGCLPYFHTWCGLSANLGCRSETCCTRLAENAGCKKVAKNRHLGIIAQIFRAISSRLRHVSTIGKKLIKLIKQQYLLHMSSEYGEL